MNWLRCRRHVVAYLYDTTDRKRRRWVQLQKARDRSGTFELDLDLPDQFSFAVLGDTGEGNASQMVLVDKFLRESEGTGFALIASDVIYPAGRSANYRTRFYVPYRHYPGPIYAVPGNHDGYDELVGFMIHFCRTEFHFRSPNRRTVSREKVDGLRRIRDNPVPQPNMYFHIDAPAVRIVGIDTGIRGTFDPEQLAWLREVSRDPRPKVLVSGKPIFRNGRRDRKLCELLKILATEGYRLVIAGDMHNFQRYRIPAGEFGAPEDIWHVVNGGGGAYLRQTHDIPDVGRMALGTRAPLAPEDFACYPSREKSRELFPGLKRGCHRCSSTVMCRPSSAAS